MAANICPICSGEIMTYRRFLKASEPSAVLVCQCCGARLKRSRTAKMRAVAAALGVVGLSSLVLYLNARDTMAAWIAVAIILALCALFALIMTSMGWRLASWVALDDPAKEFGTVPPAR